MKLLGLLLKGILSLSAVLIGATILLWVLYNDFVERQPAFNRPPWAPTFGIAPTMIATGCYWGWQVVQQFRRQGSAPANDTKADRRRH